MQETWVQSLGCEDPLEKEMATHSSTLVWKIPWIEEHGRLQSMEWQSWIRLSDFTHSLTHSLTQGCYIKIKKVISEEKNLKLVLQKKKNPCFLEKT